MNRKTLASIGLLAFVVIAFFVYKYQSQKNDYLIIEGQAQGTTFTIKYLDPNGRDFSMAVDSILSDFDKSVSTYLPSSEITFFNSTGNLTFTKPYFKAVLKLSDSVYRASNGAFDPAILPLLKIWGIHFKKSPDTLPDSAMVVRVKQRCGFDKIKFDEKNVWRTDSGVAITFNAIAQGYSVDVLADYLRKQGIENFLVEIGGETFVSGKNIRGEKWTIGVENPSDTANGRALKAIAYLSNQAMATSGNYRQYYIKDGKKYPHTIDPRTGYPVNHNLLSATVVANSCALADGFATAIMVEGFEKGKKLAEDNHLLVYLIYQQPDGTMATYQSPGLELNPY